MGLAKRAFQPHSEEACSSPDPMGTVLCPSPLWLKVYASILWLATGSVAGHSLCLGRHHPDVEASVRKKRHYRGTWKHSGSRMVAEPLV